MSIWRRLKNLWALSALDVKQVKNIKGMTVVTGLSPSKKRLATIVEESTSELLDKLDIE